ncbi:MAG: Sua5/YciO/YrdC/YwlC family protein [Mycoplasma sp.]
MNYKLLNTNKDIEWLEIATHALLTSIPIVIKTDTQIGIISNDSNLIYQIKKRPSEKMLIKLVNDQFKIEDLSELQEEFIKEIWPGAVTIIHNGESYRRQASNNLNELIDNYGSWVYSSSANISSQLPPKDINEVIESFMHYDGNILFIDSEEKNNSQNLPSTIINIDNWNIIREGKDFDKVMDFINKHKENHE